MQPSSRVYVAGHRGLVGSALLRRLTAAGHSDILTRSSAELDLRVQADVESFFQAERPEYVIVAAGTVGGIEANSTRPAEFLYDNLMIHANVLHAAHRAEARKVLYLGSSCIYPRLAPQPTTEEQLLNGPLEPTNECYAVAKVAGIKMCEAYRRQYGAPFIAAMPCNLYGPRDNFGLHDSHVLPALIRRFHEAKRAGEREVVVWGSGAALREFLHVDDLAHACEVLLDRYDDDSHINVGSGEEVSIADLADIVRQVVYPDASVRFDRSKPDGTPRKLLDSSRMRALDWRPTVALHEGVRHTYEWYGAHSQLGAQPA